MGKPVSLPIPPSANALWRVVRSCRTTNRSVILSSEYKTWMTEAIYKLRLGMDRVREYPVAIRVEVCRGEGWTAGRDLDNCLKAVVDAVKKSGRIEDDNEDYVAEVSIHFGQRVDKACVLVSVEPLPEVNDARG